MAGASEVESPRHVSSLSGRSKPRASSCDTLASGDEGGVSEVNEVDAVLRRKVHS